MNNIPETDTPIRFFDRRSIHRLERSSAPIIQSRLTINALRRYMGAITESGTDVAADLSVKES